MFTEKDNLYWKTFSDSINAQFMERKYWYSPKAIHLYKGFSVVFDNYFFSSTVGTRSYESLLTRVYSKFTYPQSLKIRIEKASFLNRLVNLFHGNLYRTLDREFDRQYHVHTMNPNTCVFLLPEIRRSLLDLNIEGLFIDTQDGIWGEQLTDNEYEVAIYVEATQLKQSELVALKELFEGILDALCDKFQIRTALTSFDRHQTMASL